MRNAAGVSGFTAEAWTDAAAYGAEVRIETTPPASTTRVASVIFTAQGGITVNEQGADADSRIEGDTATHLFVTDAGLDAVQIGTTTAGVIADFRSTAIVFNENGADRDFRVEGVGATELFFVDASAGRVGVNQPSPAQRLDVLGNMIVGAASGAAGSRIIGRGEHTSAPAGTLNAGEWELVLYDNGVSPVLRLRYNDGGVVKAYDVGPLV